MPVEQRAKEGMGLVISEETGKKISKYDAINSRVMFIEIELKYILYYYLYILSIYAILLSLNYWQNKTVP